MELSSPFPGTKVPDTNLPPRYERFQLTSATVKWRYPELSCTHTVVTAPKSSHITPILRSLHWLKINERIEYKPVLITYHCLYLSLHTINTVRLALSPR